eukprot:m.47043 g.47043  ORF g.47043 m.47043 type:complete len:263 (+) comp7306_c0_seq1:82-870(+)
MFSERGIVILYSLLLMGNNAIAMSVDNQDLESKEHATRFAVVASVTMFVCIIVVIALCSGKKKQTQQQKQSFIQKNEMKDLHAVQAAVDMQFQSIRSTGRENDDLDEDALANAKMQGHMFVQPRNSVSVSKMSLRNTKNIIHRTTKRPEAEQLIREHIAMTEDTGVFIVRAKRQDQGVYALDIGWKDAVSQSIVVSHHLLSRAPSGVYLFDENEYSSSKSLEEMLEYLSRPRNKALQGGHLATFIPSTDVIPKSDETDNSAA